VVRTLTAGNDERQSVWPCGATALPKSYHSRGLRDIEIRAGSATRKAQLDAVNISPKYSFKKTLGTRVGILY